jgi:hypothetical protein
MRRLKLEHVALLALATLLGACRDDAEKSAGAGDTTVVAADSGAPVVAPPATPDSVAGDSTLPATITVPLVPEDPADSVTGEAVISRAGTGTQVVITLRKAGVSKTYEASVSGHMCRPPPSKPQANAAEEFALQPVVTDASGTGTSTSRIGPGMERVIDCEIALWDVSGNRAKARGDIVVPHG